jgi:CxxC motif-containing protein (DUF1111 family)
MAAIRRLCLTALTLTFGCGGGQTPGKVDTADPDKALLGGDTTVFDDGDEAFNYPLRNLLEENRGPFQIGDGVFNRNWVAAPASVESSDGLGPTYNAISCAACHSNNGRGSTPASEDDPFLGLLLRLSIPGEGEHGGPNPDPSYGDQFNQFAILGVTPEGKPRVTYTERPGTYDDGTAYSLRVPAYDFTELAFGPLMDGYMISPRIAPAMVGLGLLEAVSEATILDFAKKNGGHANYVWDVKNQETRIGRFGWKANQPNLEQQTFFAFRGDIGITSDLVPGENCPPIQVDCSSAPTSKRQPNLDAIKENAMVVHALGLAVPARRDLEDPRAQKGEALYERAGCAACHVSAMTTGELEDWPELSHQAIHPFTDLLLHDMGPDLADGRPDYLATGSEWRTPPLWALGLVSSINGELRLMHDGRARGFEEAILWHGGDAEPAKRAFEKMSSEERDALVKFLSTL